MHRFEIRSVPRPHAAEFYAGKGLLSEGPLPELCQGSGKTVVAADAALAERYGAPLAKALRGDLLNIPGGEGAKTEAMASRVLEELFRLGCGRDAVLVALGGGTITDLIGFAASIYLRGIRLILVPTTLLGMVDAAIGGKTAVNTPFGKNLIGTFYPPRAVVADLNVLQSLPEKEWFNGLAEILKIGLVADESIWALSANRDDPELILRAIKKKIEIVEKDPDERSLRHILNFGHTIGHALETVSGYAMPHGAAVAIGCAAEAHLSMHLGYLPEESLEAIWAAYNRFSLRLPKTYDRQGLLQAMAHDKKAKGGAIRFVLLGRIGEALPFGGDYCRPVSAEELEPTLAWMEGAYG